MILVRRPWMAATGLLLLSWAGQAQALPDIAPELFDVQVVTRNVLAGDVVEGCAGGQTGRRLLDFSLRTKNVGADDLFLGNPGCPNCTIYPGAACANPLYVCSTSHGHAHFNSFAQSVLLDSEGNVVAEGRKYGFCLLDLECAHPQYSCSYQGISAGCADIYQSGLPCQYIDITDAIIPDGNYTLRVTMDPDNVIPESNEVNNVVEVPVTIGSTPPVCPEYVATDLPKIIPTLGSASSTLSLSDLGPVTSLRLRMSGTHTFVGDLDAHLTSPLGTDVSVMDQICGADNDFSIYVGTDGISPLVCPVTDASTLRQPSQSMIPFLGEEAAGDWTLTINDVSDGDGGSLDAWSLEICAICGNGTVDDDEVCDDGNIDDGDCCSSDCQTIGDDGAPCQDTDLCTSGDTCLAGTCTAGDTPVVCDPCLACDSARGCVPPDVLPCQDPAPGKSTVILSRNTADPSRDSVLWKWRSETPVELDEFGAPQLTTELRLCILDQTGLVMSAVAPAGELCDGRPCWRMAASAAEYRDKEGTPEGITQLRIREGKQGRILLKGRGAALELPELFLHLPVTARIIRNDGTPCWQAEFGGASENSGNRFKSRSLGGG